MDHRASASASGARRGGCRAWGVESPWFLLALLALWLLATQGVRPLLLPDEGRYASVVREMLAGDAVVPLSQRNRCIFNSDMARTVKELPAVYRPSLNAA